MATSARGIHNRGEFVCENPSSSRYASGCRCFHCMAAQRRRMREYYRSKGGNSSRKPEVERARWERLKAEGYKQPWTPSRQASSTLRDAIKRGSPESQRIIHADIFDRDGWICGICDLPVDPNLSFPHRFSASLDHVVPLSLAGSHTRKNVRCSHLTCNVARGNRVEMEALAAS